MEIHLGSNNSKRYRYRWIEIEIDSQKYRNTAYNKNTEISCVGLKSNKFALKLSI